MKKLFSIFLSASILLSVLGGMFSVNAETVTYEVGDRPYATADSRTDSVISSGEGVSFYDDFIVKDNLEAYADTAEMLTTTTWKLQAGTASVTTYSTATLNTDGANSYGGSGQSLKLTYQSKVPTPAVPQGDTVTRYYHRLASQKSISVDAAFWDTAAITFWVKTDKEVNLVLRCFDYSSGTASQWLISKEIKLLAGEHIVEIPWSSMAVTNTAYVKGNNKADSSTRTVIYYPEILIRPSAFEEGETERTLYIDNLGVYNIATNGTATAEHSTKAMTKLSIKDYVQDSSNTRKVNRAVDSLTYWWQHNDAATSTTNSLLAPADATDGVNTNAYNGVGQSIKYTATKVYDYGSAQTTHYNGIKTNEAIYNSDTHGTFWGKEATLAIWVKTSRAITVWAMAGDGKEDGNNYYKTDKSYVIPAGESVLRIPIKDFNVANPLGSGTSCDNVFTWKSIRLLRLYFQCASPRTSNLSDGITLYIDEIAIESPIIGDTNDDGTVDIIDIIRMKKRNAGVGYTDANIVYYDVAGELDEEQKVIADGLFDGSDLAALRKYLLGAGKLAVAPYVAPEAEAALVCETSSNWGFDNA